MTDISSTARRVLLLLRLVVRESTGTGDDRALRIAMTLLYLCACTICSLLPLGLLAGVEDDAARTNILNLAAVTVAVLWLVAQAVLKLPASWLVDLRPFLPLPVAHVHLYLCRLLLSLAGLWLLALGPAVFWLLATESSGLIDLLLTAATGAVLVLLLGRLAAIIELTLDRTLETGLGLAFLFALGVAALHSVIIGFEVVAVEGDPDAAYAALRESRFLAALGSTPPGLFVATLESDGAQAADLARLTVLLGLTAAAAAFEKRLLWRRYLNRPPGQTRPASPITPLAGFLRRGRRLTPAAALLLIETEAFLRGRNMRWYFVQALVFSTTSASHFLFGAVIAGVFAVPGLASQAAYQPVPGCQVWRESFTLPFGLLHLARVASGVAALLSLIALLLTCTAGLASGGLVAWPGACVALLYFAALFLSMDATSSLVRLYWPAPMRGPRDLKNLLSSLPVALPLLALMLLGGEAAFRMDSAGGFTRPVVIGAAVTVTLSALACRLAQARVAREVRTRAHTLLLEEPDH